MVTATSVATVEGLHTPSARDIADDHSLLKLDQELDLLLERIEDETEESGEASQDAMDRLQLFCQAMNVKVDRIGRYLCVMKMRAAHCRQEAARYTARMKKAENKITRMENIVLYYLETHDLKQLETDNTTLRRHKNSQDSVIVSNPEALPPELRRYELKVDGRLWMSVIGALPDEVASSLTASVKSTEPSNSAIKQHVANGQSIEGVEMKRLHHLRIT